MLWIDFVMRRKVEVLTLCYAFEREVARELRAVRSTRSADRLQKT